jgi:predicted RNase H-like nuclease (RuvC/YqgF family)
MGKLLLIVSIVFTFLSSVLGFLNKGKFSTAVEEISGLNSKLTQSQQTLAKTEGDLKSAKDAAAAATAEKEATAASLATAQGDLDKAKSQVTELTSQVTAKETQITQLTADVQAKDAKITELSSAQTGTAAEPAAEVQTQLQEKETLITKLQADLDSARTQTEELRKKEQDRAALKMRDGLQGRILAVNQAWNFVVLDLGDRNGVINNAELLVKRGSQLIGKVRITSVEPSTSIADIVANSVPGGLVIQPGDNVIYQSIDE